MITLKYAVTMENVLETTSAFVKKDGKVIGVNSKQLSTLAVDGQLDIHVHAEDMENVLIKIFASEVMPATAQAT